MFLRCFIGGVNFNPMKLLKTRVSFPVVRGTKMISPLVSWDHTTSYQVPTADQFVFGESGSLNDAIYQVSIDAESEDNYIEGQLFSIIIFRYFFCQT